jgi:hypothetical protein
VVRAEGYRGGTEGLPPGNPVILVSSAQLIAEQPRLLQRVPKCYSQSSREYSRSCDSRTVFAFPPQIYRYNWSSCSWIEPYSYEASRNSQF